MKYLPLSVIKPLEKEMKERGVSEVARSPRGFLAAYRKAGGRENRLSDWWQNRRDNFVKRHMAQVKKRDEALWDDDGRPSRRHLALIAWAYTPDRVRLTRYLKRPKMKSNPFKSQAQRRLFHAKARRGEISPKVVREWERETGKRKLPERANPATSDFMDQYRNRTWQNPMNPAQRGWSVRLASGEEAPFVLTELVERKGGGWVPHIWVKSISSPQQKSTGVASYILKQITNMADQHDTVLMLTAEPFRTGGVGRALSKAKLIGWYGRNGFISEDKDFPERMTRYPEGQKASLPLRPNPSQGPSKKALKKYKDTHWGIEANGTMRKDDPDLPKELVEMGKLLEIGVVPETQEKPYALEFPDYENTSLAFSQGKDERLYPILPKRAEQAVKKAHWKPNEPTVRLGEVNKLTGGRMDKFQCPAIQVQVLGRANYVIYQTQKLDDMKEDGQASHYIHELGEESGILPYICVAQDGTLWFAGGNYRVLNGGIAD